MAKLIYSAIASADGYVRRRRRQLRMGAPDEEVFRFTNDLERPLGTYLPLRAPDVRDIAGWPHRSSGGTSPRAAAIGS